MTLPTGEQFPVAVAHLSEEARERYIECICEWSDGLEITEEIRNAAIMAAQIQEHKVLIRDGRIF